MFEFFGISTKIFEICQQIFGFFKSLDLKLGYFTPCARHLAAPAPAKCWLRSHPSRGPPIQSTSNIRNSDIRNTQIQQPIVPIRFSWLYFACVVIKSGYKEHRIIGTFLDPERFVISEVDCSTILSRAASLEPLWLNSVKSYILRHTGIFFNFVPLGTNFVGIWKVFVNTIKHGKV